MKTAGYSGTPLVKKLGIKDDYNCLIFNAPDHYFDLLFGLPETATFTEKAEGSFHFIHAFFTHEVDLLENWEKLKSLLNIDGTFWISWPKGSSKLEKDINENDIRRIGLQGGLVDVKVCAVDNDWSGLKFMYRKKDR
ncbi:MAG: DUF3052 domain-containing protein [Cyclobacteriaceae bacterium]